MVGANGPLICKVCEFENPQKTFFCANCGSLLLAGKMTVSWNSSGAIGDTINWESVPGELPARPTSEASEIAHFQVLEKLGQGGMGMVYKAHDLQLDRVVALKIFRSSLLSANQGQDLLLREAKLASALNHPNIVTIYDIARNSELSFIAMEWVDGKTLADLIPNEGLPLDQILDYAAQIARGLTCAHEHGIIHRDIKPGNIMVTGEGQIKILDFGVARAGGAADWGDWSKSSGISRADTTLGAIKGTPAFMSPEQARGEAVDARSDIFSFGAVLYQMLTGKQAFMAKPALEIFVELFTGEPESVNRSRDDVPPSLDALLVRCLRKEREERFPDMAAVLEAIEAVRVQLPRAPIATTRSGRGFHGWVWAIALAVVLLPALVWPPARNTLGGLIGLSRPNAPGQSLKLAVLPLENISGDPLLQVFCDGLSATLSGYLTRMEPFRPGTWVVPASEVSRIKELSTAAVRQNFGVDRVIQGRVQHHGESRRLELALVDTLKDEVIARRVIDFNEDHLFSIQDKVLEAVLGLLDWQIPMPMRQSMLAESTTISGAYKHYLFGLGYLYRYDRDDNPGRAIESFEAAVSLDPTYLQAYVGLSEAHLVQWRLTDDPAWLDVAIERANHVIGLNPLFAGAYVTRGSVLREKGEFSAAEGDFKRALELEPGTRQALYGLAKVYEQLERPDQAESTYLEALQRNPNDWVGHTKLGIFYFTRGANGKAETIFRKLIELSPNNVYGYHNLAAVLYAQDRGEEALIYLGQALEIKPSEWVYTTMGTILFYQGKVDEAIPFFEKAVEARPTHSLMWGNLGDAYRWSSGSSEKAEPTYAKAIEIARNQLEATPKDVKLRLYLALYLAKSGRAAETRDQLTLLGRPGEVRWVYLLAMAHELLGERRQALEFLEAALAENYSLNEVSNEPEFNRLREDPQYRAMLQKLQLN